MFEIWVCQDRKYILTHKVLIVNQTRNHFQTEYPKHIEILPDASSSERNLMPKLNPCWKKSVNSSNDSDITPCACIQHCHTSHHAVHWMTASAGQSKVKSLEICSYFEVSDADFRCTKPRSHCLRAHHLHIEFYKYMEGFFVQVDCVFRTLQVDYCLLFTL